MWNYIMFGLWTLLCVCFGNWLQWRKSIYKGPIPDVFVGSSLEDE